jgi:hypothetical protein
LFISIVLATISFYLLERPILRYRNYKNWSTNFWACITMIEWKLILFKASIKIK